MQVRQHRSQHEAAEELPLLTESAVVTDVSAMDHNRSEQALAELRATLEEYGTPEWHRSRPSEDEACEEWLRDRLDPVDHLEGGTPLSEFLPDSRRSGAVGEKLDALQARYLQPYPSLVRFSVRADEEVEFVPGQYLSIGFEDTTRVYSVANSPTEDEVEFCIRRVPGGEMTTELIVDLEVGDTVTLRGPYGEFLMEEPSDRDLVFLATGTGVAPLRSMVDYLFETGRDEFEGHERDVWLFLGAAWEDELPYHEVFRSHADERENFHYVPTLSREPYLTGWDGETDYVQQTLVKYLAESVDVELGEAFAGFRGESPAYDVDARLEPSNMEVYACGINAMVHSLVDAAERLGVPPEHTQFEGFG